MKVITYVNGVLTVIRGDEFFRETHPKPSFIVGNEFYYEPTLKLTQGRTLTPSEESNALAYIESFVFPKFVPYNPVEVHCVDRYGNYVGRKPIGEGEYEVTCAPVEIRQGITWDFEKEEWYESVLVDSRDGTLFGTGLNIHFDHSTYVRADKVHQDFCFESQKYDFDKGEFRIDIEIVRRTKKNKINFEFNQAVQTQVGIIGFGEVASWKLQEDEARAWVSDNTIATPLVDALLSGRELGETKAELIGKIIAKADAYKMFYGYLLGRLHLRIKQIEEATTIEEVKAVEW